MKELMMLSASCVRCREKFQSASSPQMTASLNSTAHEHGWKSYIVQAMRSLRLQILQTLKTPRNIKHDYVFYFYGCWICIAARSSHRVFRRRGRGLGRWWTIRRCHSGLPRDRKSVVEGERGKAGGEAWR